MSSQSPWRGETARGGRPRRLALLTLIAGLALSGLFAWIQRRSNDAHAAREFDALAEDTADRLFARFRLYEYGLRGVRGSVLTGGGEGISRATFRVYHESRDVAVEFPGARGFGFIRRVPVDREAEFVAEVRRDDEPEFELRQLTPHDGERYVIQYVEPIERNRAAIGLDIASEVNRRAAAERALRTGGVALTRPITLVQAPDERLHGFLVLLPIYRPGLPITSEAEREAAAFGWSYAPLVIAEVLAGFDVHGGAIAMSLYDGDGADGPFERFYESTAPRAAGDAAPVRRIVRPIFGRTWQVELWAQPPFFARLNLLGPRAVFAIGALISSLLAALLYAYLLSADRKRQILADQLRLATIVENSSDAIVAENLDGVITGWNRAAERIFGYSADEAIGRPARKIFPLVESDRHQASAMLSVSGGIMVEPFDLAFQRRDGSRVEVSMTVSPITASDGRVIGVGKTLRDISARKEAKRQLEEFNARLERQVGERTAQLETARRDLQTILDALPSMVGYWDTGLTCRFANRAYHEWFGVDPHSLPGRHMRELLGARLFAANLPHIEAAMRGEPQVFERSIPRPDGRGVRHSLAHYLPDVVAGEVRGFYVLVFDVSELTESRQKLAAAIRENEALLRTIKSHVLYSVTDPEGRIVDINEVFCQTSGYSREELIGQRHRLFGSDVHPPEFWAEMWGTLVSGRAWRGEICNRTKRGEPFWTDTIIAPFFGEDGAVEKYVSLRSDITAQKTAIRELDRERQRLDNILRGTDVGTWEWNVQTGETHVNERWAALVGHTLAELSPLTIDAWNERTHPDDLAQARRLLRRHFAGELEQYECEVRIRHRDGGWVWVLDRGRVTTWSDGRPEWMHGTRQDVTARHAADDALREAMRAAEAASAAKTEFLANISHEIRTPLHAILGLSHLLERSTLDAEQRRSVSALQIAGQSLLGIVNDVLDMAKIEAGGLTIDVAPFGLREALDELAAMFAAQARAKRLEFVLEVAADLPAVVEGDAVRVRQIFVNLLSNAIKFTEAGSVQLAVEVIERGERRVRVRSSVRDTGVGIPLEVQGRLFTPFTQADASTTRRFGGTGLGLSIVRRLVEKMDGEVGFASEVGRGSEFWVVLPLGLPAASVAPRAGAAAPGGVERSPRLVGARVLVVDDSDINCKLATKILAGEGAAVTSAGDGVEALERLRAAPDGFDVVLMDIQMPRMDGIEATSRIRGELGLSELPVIAVTAGALVAERQRSLEAGMSAFISKPLHPDTLIRVVLRHLDERRDAPR